MRSSRRQADLLGWVPPAATTAFEPTRVRAASIAHALSRGVSETLDGCADGRMAVATRMAAYLGEPVSKSALDAYASPAREEAVIPATKLMALLHATRDRRLLQLIAEPFGWVVIERRYLPMIDLAALREHEAEIKQQIDATRRRVREGGLL